MADQADTQPETGDPALPADSQADGDVGRRIVVGGAVVAVATAILKLSSLFWKQSLAWAFGVGDFTDAHIFAVNGVAFLVFQLVLQTVAPAFLPVFMGERKTSGERAAWRFASAVLTLVFALSALAAALAFAFPGAWGRSAAWLAGKELRPETAALLEGQIRYVSPAFIGLAVSVVTYMILNGYKRFFWAQTAETSMRAAMIATIVAVAAAGAGLDSSARIVGLGVAAGALARVVTHLGALGGRLRQLRAPAFRTQAFARFLLLAAPLFAGAVIAQTRDFVNYYGVLLPVGEGIVTANNFGRSICSVMEWLVPVSLGIAMFPYFCDLVDRNDIDALGGILTRSGRVLALFFFAFAAAAAALSGPFAHVVFGVFRRVNEEELALVALANACYVCVLPALAVEKLLMQGFYSNRRMVAPTAIGAVFSFASVGVSILGVRVFRVTGAEAIATVALGYVGSRYMKTAVLALMLRRRVPVFPSAEGALGLVAVAAACGGAAFAVRLGYEWLWPLEATLHGGRARVLLRAVPEIAIAGAAAIVAGLVVMKLIGMEELGWVRDWVRRKRSGAGADDRAQER